MKYNKDKFVYGTTSCIGNFKNDVGGVGRKRCLDDTVWIVQSNSLLYDCPMSIWWSSSSRAVGRVSNPLSYLLDDLDNKFCL